MLKLGHTAGTGELDADLIKASSECMDVPGSAGCFVFRRMDADGARSCGWFGGYQPGRDRDGSGQRSYDSMQATRGICSCREISCVVVSPSRDQEVRVFVGEDGYG